MTPTPQTTPTRDEAVLLPCPFCGGPAKTFQWNGTLQASCAGDFTDCAGFDVTAPVAMWNRRASAPAPASGRVDADEVKRIRDWLLERNRDHLAAMHERTHIMSRKDGDAEMFLDAAILLCHLASLPPAATPGLAMPSREWMRDKIAADPDVEDCGAVPAATPVSEAGGEAARSWRRTKFEFIGAMRQALINSGLTREQVIIADNAITEAFSALAKPASSPAGGDVEAAMKRAWLAVRGQPVGGGDGQTYVVPSLTNDVMRKIVTAALSQSTSAGRVGE